MSQKRKAAESCLTPIDVSLCPTPVSVEIEYCLQCEGTAGKARAVERAIRAAFPIAIITSFKGRKTSFEVVLKSAGDKLLWSGLAIPKRPKCPQVPQIKAMMCTIAEEHLTFNGCSSNKDEMMETTRHEQKIVPVCDTSLRRSKRMKLKTDA
eukprot:GILJ01011597.1.p1 GENE.GILJ01011597.1~~GILJ01011597.1.p1  ORF type:complete len:152 (+),score=20.39 GILJ01011597.1:162-617(+)